MLKNEWPATSQSEENVNAVQTIFQRNPGKFIWQALGKVG
jgi:hypothetical protein